MCVCVCVCVDLGFTLMYSLNAIFCHFPHRHLGGRVPHHAPPPPDTPASSAPPSWSPEPDRSPPASAAIPVWRRSSEFWSLVRFSSSSLDGNTIGDGGAGAVAAAAASMPCLETLRCDFENTLASMRPHPLAPRAHIPFIWRNWSSNLPSGHLTKIQYVTQFGQMAGLKSSLVELQNRPDKFRFRCKSSHNDPF